MTQRPTAGFDAEFVAGEPLFRLLLAARRDQIATAQAATAAVAESLGFDLQARRLLELAVEEAMSNAIDHAYVQGEAKPIELEARRSASHLELLVRDRGIPFDPGTAPRYRLPNLLDDASVEGLGLFLINAVTDEARFRNLGRAGKELLLRKRLPTAPLAPDLAAPAEPPHAERWAETGEFGLRPLRRGEAVEVARLLYEAHDFSFPFEEFYRPDQLEALIEAGDVDCLVAEAEGPGILGLVALRRNPLLPGGRSVVALVVRQPWRGRGIAGRLLQAALASAEQSGRTGLSAEVVTGHPTAQRIFARAGFQACCLLPAYFTPMAFPGLAVPDRPRESLVLLHRPLHPRPAGLGYAPAALVPLLASLLLRLGPGTELVSPDGRPRLSGPDVSEARLIGALSTLQILVRRPGIDSLTRLRRTCEIARRNQVSVIEILLPLAEPATVFLAEALQPLGLLPVGLRPGTAVGDALVLLRENGWPVTLSDLALDDPAMRLLAAQIERRRDTISAE